MCTVAMAAQYAPNFAVLVFTGAAATRVLACSRWARSRSRSREFSRRMTLWAKQRPYESRSGDAGEVRHELVNWRFL